MSIGYIEARSNKQGAYMRQASGRKSIFTILAILTLSIVTHAKEKPPENRVSIDEARKVAISVFPGKVSGEELEFEGGKWIYSFDLKSAKDSRVHEVHVDAITGKFLSKHTETAADEKKETQEEARDEGGE